jgi:Molecular chaperone GrpE (heat shock protein)
MTKRKKHQEGEEPNEKEPMTAQDSEVQENTTTNTDAEKKIAENEQPKIAGPSLEEQLAESKDRYLRLSAEFDNFRKRSRKEREDLIKTAGESVITELLHVVDDYDRALKSIDQATDIQAIKEGIQLISNKFEEFLKRQGVTEIDAIGHELNTDLHEAITKIPSPDENAKGKVVEVIQKGYMLNEKVIRYSKVIVGE